MQEVECQEGVPDCDVWSAGDDGFSCAYYDQHYPSLQGNHFMVTLAGIVMAGMGMAVGGNDVANAWGTSVGSGAISVQYGLLVAAVSNALGATLLGSGVADTLQKSVASIEDPTCFACGYCNSRMTLYSLGMLSALFSAALFLFLATTKKLPVSTTHAIVGGVLGISIGATRDVDAGLFGMFHGFKCVDWSMSGFGGIVFSWVLSPLFAGVICCILYFLTSLYIYETLDEDSASSIKPNYSINNMELNASQGNTNVFVHRALRLLPVCYGGVTWTTVYLICSKSAVTKGLPYQVHFVIAAVATIIVCILVMLKLIGYITEELRNISMNSTTSMSNESSHSDGMDRSINPLVSPDTLSSGTKESSIKSDEERASSCDGVQFCFRHLLLFVAALESFSHGANDTANATAPLSAVVRIYRGGLDVCGPFHTQIWIMALGGSFVAIGVILFGKGVLETIGRELTKINCHKAFCIEFSSCLAVVLASVIGFPVSTTHCQVGAVVSLGMYSSGSKSVNWHLVYEIVLSWVLTVPFAAVVSIGILHALKLMFL